MGWIYLRIVAIGTATALLGVAPAIRAQAVPVGVARRAPDSTLDLPPEVRAALVVVGRVEGVDYDEYERPDYTERLYTVTLKVSQVRKGDGPRVGESLRFQARLPHARHVGLLGNSDPLIILVRDEVDWVPQIGDTVRVSLDPAPGYYAVAGQSIAPDPVPAGGPPTAVLGEKRVLRTEDWVAVAAVVGLAMFVGGLLLGRRWGLRRSGVSTANSAEPGAATDRAGG
jgi:hypothetical protein